MTNMNQVATSKKNAVIIGILFICATAAGILSVVILGPMLDGPDYLSEISANANEVILAALIELFMAAAIGGIGVYLYSVMKNQDRSTALGYVVARIFEGVAVIFAAIFLLSLLVLSQGNVNASALQSPFYELTGTLLQVTRDLADLVGTQFFFGLTALILNYSLYQSRLVPRFISAWGLLGAIMIFTASLLTLFGVIGSFSMIAIILYLPIALQEMVFAGWLIIKGFNPSAATPKSANA